MKRLSDIVVAVQDYPAKRMAVAAAVDLTVIKAIKAAIEGNIATAILVGDEKSIYACVKQIGLSLAKQDVIHMPASERAAYLVSSGIDSESSNSTSLKQGLAHNLWMTESRS